MTDLQCTATSCPLVIGRVLVYDDAAHLTPAYARTTVPWFRAKVGAAVRGVAKARREG